MPLLEQSILWLLPYIFLMLFMVHAMMEFTLTFLIKRPPAKGKPTSQAKLKQRLLALNEPGQAYRLAAGPDWDLEEQWQVIKPEWRQDFAQVKLTSHYQARFLLDETRHEVRLQEHIRTTHFFLGFDGWRPRCQWYFSAFWGPIGSDWTGQAYGILAGFPPMIGDIISFHMNTVQLKKDITQIAHQYGWAVRPVIWTFHVRHSRQRLIRALTPGVIERLPAARFWGVTYPATYFLGIAYLAFILGRESLTLPNLFLLLGISAAWWGAWGLFIWSLYGFPAFWRRKRKAK